MIERSHLNPLGPGVGRRLQLGKINRLEQLLLSIKYADVWAIEFISGAGKKIAIDLSDVAKKIRRVMNRINQRKCAD